MFLMPSEVMIHIYSYYVGGFVCDLTEKIKLVSIFDFWKNQLKSPSMSCL